MSAVSTDLVRKLRDMTGAGMMDCKRALEESGGDEQKAIEFLRKKGAATAAKRAEKETNQGLVESYIHAGGRIGTLIELNCETDFVAKTEEFKKLARDLAMQVAAMSPKAVSRDKIDPDIVKKELEIYAAQAENEGKKPEIATKIAEGRLEKFYAESVLMEMEYIKDPSKRIKDLVDELTAKVGEKIQIRRFVRFHLGE